MPQYLLSLHVGDDAGEPMTDDEMQESYRQIGALNDEMQSAGAWVYAGRLEGPEAARVVRTTGDEVLITDGPFVESKELLAGFYVIEAEDIDAALGWAAKATAAIGRPIEVRPFFGGPAS